MKPLLIANTVIANKETAKNVVRRLNSYLEDDFTYESVLAIDLMIEKIVKAGFLDWDEVEALTY